MARAIHKLTARAAGDDFKAWPSLRRRRALSLRFPAEGRRRPVFLYTWRGKDREAGIPLGEQGRACL